MSTMFSLRISVLVSGLLYSYGDACSSNADCVTLATATSDRKYCCGQSFCCTLQQLRMGVTEDLFTSLSIPGIVGLVGGILVFLSICGVILYCLLKKRSNKRFSNGIRRNSLHGDDSDLRRSTSSARPGHAVPVNKRSTDYDYPPDTFDVIQPPPPSPYRKHTIPIVVGTYDGSFEYSKKHNKSRYAYDGPAAYDSDEYQYKYHSRRKDYSSHREHRNGDSFGTDEDSQDRRYQRDENSRNRRYYRNEHPHDRRHHKDEFLDGRRYREGDYSYDRGYAHDYNRRY